MKRECYDKDEQRYFGIDYDEDEREYWRVNNEYAGEEEEE